MKQKKQVMKKTQKVAVPAHCQGGGGW